MARNLISLIDGTMVSAAPVDRDASYSNIFELACLLQLTDRSADGSPQIVFYTSGISSHPDTASIRNLLTGNSIKSQIIDQYTNICANFDFDAAKANRPDKIYLFGFSRGAMAIRALAGLIAEFGLLHPRDIRFLPLVLDAWDRTQGRGSLPDHIRLIDAEVEFIGLFDAVMGGVEWLSLFNPVRFSNAMLPARCRNGVHLLAIDENRGYFKPMVWAGLRSSRGRELPGGPERFLRQIWMPGLHSDVGGTGTPVWGRAALLAMCFYMKKLTQLRLNEDWLLEKQNNLCRSFEDERLSINRHRGLFSRYARVPEEQEGSSQRRHPICEEVKSVSYGRIARYDWRENVFQRRFANVICDEDLSQYFRGLIRPGCP